MAAELSTLASSFLDTKPETYAPFFLECARSKQYLSREKIPDSWVGKVNTFLNSKTDSWLGVCLLGITVDQCDTDTFTKNCASWIRSILQIIQVSDETNAIQYCSKLIDDILRYAIEFSELSRDLSNSVIPAIISAMLSKKCTDTSAVLAILSSCIRYFPGPTGPFRNQIENFLLSLFNSPCEETRKDACHCYALLPRCSRHGNSGKKQVCPWQAQWNKVLYTIHKLLDATYENVEPVSSRSSQAEPSSEPKTLPLGEIPQVEPDRTHTLVTRCNTLLYCLSAMIREEYLKVVTVPIDSTISLLTRIMSVTSNSLKNAVVVESVLLRATLPLIHTNAVMLLTDLVTRCRSLMLPYCDLVIRLLIQELTWTKCQDPKYGQQKPYRNLRCSVYQCLEHWVQVTNSLPEEGGMVAKLMQHVLDDIKPLISQTKLLPSTSNGNPQMSKKAKKRKLQEDVDQLLTGQQKFDSNANELVTNRALRALSGVLIASGGDIPQETFREIQVCIIKLVMQCQQSPYNSFPIPFSSAACRKAMYHVLLCCLLTNSPYVPSPVNHAVRLFRAGLQDADLKVSSFCQEALAVTNSIIHPRSFPQVCSAPGPLLLGTSEHPSFIGSSPGAHHQSISDSYPASALNQMTSQDDSSQQSILRREASQNENSIAYSQIEENTVRYGQWQGTAEDNNTPSMLLTTAGNKSTEESQLLTSDKHTEKSNVSRYENNLGSQQEKAVSKTQDVIVTNTDSQTSGIQLTASSSNTPTEQLLNQEGFITENTRKTSSSNYNHRTANTGSKENGISLHLMGEEPESVETLGTSEPKRRRTDDNFNVSDEQLLTDNQVVAAPSKDHMAGGTEEKEAITFQDTNSDETATMLATFVDSYPDSDEQEIA